MKKLYLLIPTLFLILNFSTASNSDDFANKSKNPKLLGFPSEAKYSSLPLDMGIADGKPIVSYFGDVKKGKAYGQGAFEFGYGRPFNMNDGKYPGVDVDKIIAVDNFINNKTLVSNNKYVGGVKNNKPHGKGAISLDLTDNSKATFTGKFNYGVMVIDPKQWLQQGGKKYPKEIRMDAIINPEFFGRVKSLDKYSAIFKRPMQDIYSAGGMDLSFYSGGFLIQPKMRVNGKWYPAKKINDDAWELTKLGFIMYEIDQKPKPGDGDSGGHGM